MKVLVMDVGGRPVKVLLNGEREPRMFESGPKLTAKEMITGVKRITGDRKCDAVSIGFAGPVLKNRPAAEPRNLGKRWVGFNDAAMQGFGSYKRGKMLRLGPVSDHRGWHRGSHGIGSSAFTRQGSMKTMSEITRY